MKYLGHEVKSTKIGDEHVVTVREPEGRLIFMVEHVADSELFYVLSEARLFLIDRTAMETATA